MLPSGVVGKTQTLRSVLDSRSKYRRERPSRDQSEGTWTFGEGSRRSSLPAPLDALRKRWKESPEAKTMVRASGDQTGDTGPLAMKVRRVFTTRWAAPSKS